MPISTSKFGLLRDSLIIRIASLFKLRIVTHLHGSGLKPFYASVSPKLQSKLRQTYARVDCCIVLGELLKDQFNFVPNWQEKVIVVLNGTPIDVSEIPTALVKHPPQAGEPWRFLFLSNLMPTKGYQELVKACRMLVDQGIENFQCDLCGEFLCSVVENERRTTEEQKADFLKSIADPKVAKCLNFHGTVSGANKTELLEKSHVLVLPTYYPWEGQPLSINEALAWATPVVTTEHRGIPEQVIDGENGYYVKPKDVESLAACLQRFVEGEVPYEKLSENARLHYESNFTNERHISSLVPLLVK